MRALSVRIFFDDPHNRELVEKLRSAGLNFVAEKTIGTDSQFNGKIFVLTGTLKSMGRAEAKNIIEKFGGKVASSVTAKTDYLISDGEINGAKAQTAQRLGTKILTENDFLQMIKNVQTEDATSTINTSTKSEDNQLFLNL